MDSITVFHDGILLWTAGLITLFVLALLVIVMVRFNAKANPVPSTNTHNTLIEIVWTVLPIVILVIIAMPSFGVLSDQLTIPDGERKYLGSNIFSFGEVEVPAPELTLKVTGSTWFWTYEYVDQGKSFDFDHPQRSRARRASSRTSRVCWRSTTSSSFRSTPPSACW